MESDNRSNSIGIILFYAALWGVVEATLGWALHFINAPVSGFIMFPIAMYILLSAYRRLSNPAALIIIGIIAAAIKLVNLFFPGLPPIRTINPAVALICEAGFAALVIPRLDDKGIFEKLGYSALVSMAWRSAFLAYVFIVQLTTGMQIGLLRSVNSILVFLLLNGIVNAIITWGVILLENRPKASLSLQIKRPLLVAVPLMIAAVFLQYTL